MYHTGCNFLIKALPQRIYYKMWNPAAAGAPPPIANPLHGAPATQQFWPQWQAAVQYYQAASATTTTTDTTTTNEAASGGGGNIDYI